MGNIIRKKDEKQNMIKISKAEAQYLVEHGCKHHSDVHRTVGQGKRYYATESDEVLELLAKRQEEVRLKQ